MLIAVPSLHDLACAAKGDPYETQNSFDPLLPAVVRVTSSFAQSTPEKAPDTSTELRNAFNEVNEWVTKAAEMVPADKYNYRPVDTVRTFGQLIAHVTDSYNYFCAHGVGNKVEWTDTYREGHDG